MDTDDLPSSEQSNVVSMVSEIATDTDVTSSEDDSDHDSSSTDFSLSMDDALPQHVIKFKLFRFQQFL